MATSVPPPPPGYSPISALPAVPPPPPGYSPVEEESPVRGTEAFGGQLPAMPKPPVPEALLTDEQRAEQARAAQLNKPISPQQVGAGAMMGGLPPTTGYPGAERIVQGVEAMAHESAAQPQPVLPARTGRGTPFQPVGAAMGGMPPSAEIISPEQAAGLSDVIQGTMEAATPVLPAALAAAPLGTAATLAGATATGAVTKKGLEKAGVRPEYAGLAGDVAALLVGAGGAAHLLRKAYEAAGSPEVKVGGKFDEPKDFRDMTDAELVAHANTIERDPPKNYEWQKKEIVKEAQRREAGKGLSTGEAPTEQPPPPGYAPVETQAAGAATEAAAAPPAPESTPIAQAAVEPGAVFETPTGTYEVGKISGDKIIGVRTANGKRAPVIVPMDRFLDLIQPATQPQAVQAQPAVPSDGMLPVSPAAADAASATVSDAGAVLPAEAPARGAVYNTRSGPITVAGTTKNTVLYRAEGQAGAPRRVSLSEFRAMLTPPVEGQAAPQASEVPPVSSEGALPVSPAAAPVAPAAVSDAGAAEPTEPAPQGKGPVDSVSVEPAQVQTAAHEEPAPAQTSGTHDLFAKRAEQLLAWEKGKAPKPVFLAELDQKPEDAARHLGALLEPSADPAHVELASQLARFEAPASEHKFSSTQVNLPPAIAGRMRQFTKGIPDEHLGEEGREAEGHITALYGLTSDDVAPVRAALANQAPITVTLGKTSLFKNDDADVLKVDVDSPELHALNKKLSALPNENTHPEYQPHATLAYLKPGQGAQYEGKDVPGVSGQTVTLDSLRFSSMDGKTVDIPLKGEASATPGGPSQTAEGTVRIEGSLLGKRRIADMATQPRGPWQKAWAEGLRGLLYTHGDERGALALDLGDKSKPSVLRGNDLFSDIIGKAVYAENFNGLNIDGDFARNVREKLQAAIGSAGLPKALRAPLTRLYNAVNRVVQTGSDLIFINSTIPVEQQESLLRHEKAHSAQRRLSGGRFAGHAGEDNEFLNHPVAELAAGNLVSDYEYPNEASVLVAEIGARLLADDEISRDEMGLTPEQYSELQTYYGRRVLDARGLQRVLLSPEFQSILLRPEFRSIVNRNASSAKARVPTGSRVAGATGGSVEGIQFPEGRESPGRPGASVEARVHGGLAKPDARSSQIHAAEPGQFGSPNQEATARPRDRAARAALKRNPLPLEPEPFASKLKSLAADESGALNINKLAKAVARKFASRTPGPHTEKDPWKFLAAGVESLSDENLLTAFHEDLAEFVHAIEGVQGMPDHLSEQATDMANSGDAGALRDYLSTAFNEAAGLHESNAAATTAAARNSAGLKALKDADGQLSDKNFGEKARTFATGERDIRIAEGNQLRDRLKRLVKDPQQQEALSLMRDFKHLPGELEQFRDGTHAALRNMPRDERAEAREQIAKLAPVIELALHPTPEMNQADEALTQFFTAHEKEGKKLGMFTSSLSNEEYITHLLEAKPKPGVMARTAANVTQRFRAGKIGPKRFQNAKERKIPTLLHAVTWGVPIKTLNALDAMTVYNDRYAASAAARLFEIQVKRAAVGKWGSSYEQKTGEIPADWVELARETQMFHRAAPYVDAEGKAHIAQQSLFVPPEVERAMRAVFLPDYLHNIPGYGESKTYQSYIKAVELSLSAFHMKALNLAALGNDGPTGVVKAWISDMTSPEFEAAERAFVHVGGTTPILGRTIEAYKALTPSSLPSTADRIRSAPGIHQIDQAAQAITHLTFDVLQRKFKVTGFAIKDAAWVADHPEATPAERYEAQRQIAKEINAVFGGLHWENLGINRTTLGAARLLLLAPDWTFSNWVTAKYAFEGGAGGNAARLYWIKSAILMLGLTAATSLLLSGKRAKDPTRVLLGKDKQGLDITQNMYFTGAAGDLSNLIHYANSYGLLGGLGHLTSNKLGNFGKATLHFLTREDERGRPVTARDAGVLKNTTRVASQLAKDVIPVPFGLSTAIRMNLDPKQRYSVSDYLGTILGGTPPTHERPARLAHPRKEIPWTVPLN